jgi:hypothetical protein
MGGNSLSDYISNVSHFTIGIEALIIHLFSGEINFRLLLNEKQAQNRLEKILCGTIVIVFIVLFSSMAAEMTISFCNFMNGFFSFQQPIRFIETVAHLLIKIVKDIGHVWPFFWIFLQ